MTWCIFTEINKEFEIGIYLHTGHKEFEKWFCASKMHYQIIKKNGIDVHHFQ
jgi:hypothetical protein